MSSAPAASPAPISPERSRKLIAAWFRDLIGRGPDPRETVSWGTHLSNQGPGFVALTIARSPEVQQRVFATLAKRVLGSVPPDRMAEWSEPQAQAARLHVRRDARMSLVLSHEFKQKFGPRWPAWIDGVHRVMLGRPATPVEAGAWNLALEREMPPSHVVFSIGRSSESIALALNSMMSEYLGHKVPDAGLPGFVSQALAGMSDEEFLVGCLTSDEYALKNGIPLR